MGINDVLFKSKLNWRWGVINHPMEEYSIVFNGKNQMIPNNKIVEMQEIPSRYKNKSIGQLDAILWRWFSIYIRLKYADKRGDVTCVTCGKKHHWKDIHAGHFVRRGHKSVKYSETNVHPQCTYCNTFLDGNEYQHGKYIERRYGAGTADALIKEGKKVKKFNRLEIANLILHYTNEAKRIAEEKKIKI